MIKNLFRRRPLIEELEPRILFSADLAPLAYDASEPEAEQRIVQADGEYATAVAATRSELVIVDARVEDYQRLIDDIVREAGGDRHFEIIVLDAGRDGIAQISEALRAHGGLDAVHLISHGEAGRLQLGSSWLDLASLDTRAGEIGAWAAAFGEAGDLLLYGCNVAAGEEGLAFLAALSSATGADVAASDDLTGDAARGGDWVLEYASGRIETVAMGVSSGQWQGVLETLANVTVSNKDTNAAVAVNPATGAYVVAWTADGNQDGNSDGVFARLYDASGNPVGAEFKVNTVSVDSQRNPTVAMAANGTFVVVWESKSEDYGIFGQRFDASGNKIGGQFGINQYTDGDQTNAAIAMNAAGEFVVAWVDARNSGDIYVRHYDTNGVAKSNAFRVHDSTANGQLAPDVAIGDDGSYVVTWQSDTGGSGKSIFAQRFSPSDAPAGSAFRVNATDANDQTQPAIAMAPDGRFVIAWSSNSQDGGGRGVYAQRYAADGSVNGGEFLVNTYTSGHQDRPTVAIDAGGNFVIAWTSDGQDNGGSLGVYAQRYFADGLANGGEFLVNATTSGDQQRPAAAMSAAGKLLIAWDGNGPGDDKGIFWRSYVPANAVPVATADADATDEDTLLAGAAPGVLVNDNDPDGVVLNVSAILAGTTGTATTVTTTGVTVAGAYGSLTMRQDGSYTYTPNATTAQALAAGQSAVDVFTYTVRDAHGADASSTLTITVNGRNDAPVAAGDAYAVDKSGTLTVSAAGVLANDIDADTNPVPDTLSVTQVNGSAGNVGVQVDGTWGKLWLYADGRLSYVPDYATNLIIQTLAPGDSRVDTFTYRVSDGKGGTSDASLSITINGQNTAPAAVDDAYGVAEDGSLSVGAASGVLQNDTDPESNALTASLVAGVTNGVLALNPDGSFSYTPNANFNGTDSFTYRASDGSNVSNIATVTITVAAVNDAPKANADVATLNQGATTGGNVLANDTDVDTGDSASVIVVEGSISGRTVAPGAPGVITSSYGTLTLNADGSYTYVADGAASLALKAGESSEDTFTYTMRDAAGVSSESTLTIKVNGLNDAPATTPVTLAAIAEDSGARVITQAELLANASDVDGDTLTASALVKVSGNGTLVDNGNGTWTYTPAANDDTGASFSYTIGDGAASIAGSATLDITPVNDAPTTTPVALAAIAEDSGPRLITQAELLANASDVEGGPLTASNLVKASGSGVLVDNGNGTWTYTPAANDDTGASFSYTISDGAAATAGSATLDITPVNDAPQFTVGTTHMSEEGRTASVAATAGDVDLDALVYAIAGGADAALFTLDASTGLLTLSLVPDHASPQDADRDNVYEVIVTVSDGQGGTATIAIRLVVTAKPEPASALPEAMPPASEAAAPEAEETPSEAPAPLPVAEARVAEDPIPASAAPDLTVSVVYQGAIGAEPPRVILNAAELNRNGAAAGTALMALNQALGAITGDMRAMQLLQASLTSDGFQQQLDRLQDAIRQQLTLDKNAVASTLAVTTGLSVGYVVWLIRGGVLLSSLLTSLPAWRLIDPLPILGHLGVRNHGHDDDESLEGMLKKSRAQSAAAPRETGETTP